MKTLFYIGHSAIHGKGVFSNTFIPKHKVVGTMCYFYNPLKVEITQLGKFVNHSNHPNCFLYQQIQGKYALITRKNINDDTELTINYNKNPFFLKKAEQNFN